MAEWDPEKNFENLTAEVALSNGDFAEATRRLFRENAPGAAQAIVHLAGYSLNEKIRLDAARYVVDRVLGKPDANAEQSGEGDVFDKLLKDITREAH